MAGENEQGQVYAGVDTHEDTIHVAVISARGHDLDDQEFLRFTPNRGGFLMPLLG